MWHKFPDEIPFESPEDSWEETFVSVPVLVFNNKRQFVCYFHKSEFSSHWYVLGGNGEEIDNVTYWMYLPLPPERQ